MHRRGFLAVVAAAGLGGCLSDTGPKDIEMAIHERVNAARSERGASTLAMSEDLRALAQDHSRAMATRDFFGHVGPNGKTWDPEGCGRWGENIYFEEGRLEVPESVADRTVSWWMDSPPHRENLLNSAFSAEGIGVAESDDGELYVTQSLC